MCGKLLRDKILAHCFLGQARFQIDEELIINSIGGNEKSHLFKVKVDVKMRFAIIDALEYDAGTSQL